MHLPHRLRCVVLAILTTGVTLSASAADPIKLRVGWVNTPSQLPPIMLAKEGIARHAGRSYTLEPIRFTGTPAMLKSFAAGGLDIAPLTFFTFAQAILAAGITDLRIIADGFQDGVEGYQTNTFLVHRDSPVKSVSDLKGTVVASNGFGGGADIAMRAMLRRHGLEDKRDYTVTFTEFSRMKDLLAQRKVDLIMVINPFGRDPELRAISRTLFTEKDAIGTTQTAIWTARAGFLKVNRAAVTDYLEDYLRVLGWYSDPKNVEEVLRIVTAYTKQPRERFEGWIFAKGDYYRDPKGIPDLKALQGNLGLLKELGFLKSDIDVASYSDLSLVNAAGSRVP
jgi:sulfonate transport system substrate-binding protein